jgi:leucine dehydrogenase
MKELLKNWDGEEVIIRYDQATGAWIFIAIHSTVLGPADGGTRIKYYDDVRFALGDALKLSRGMTYKFAISGVPRGGGKTVIKLPADFNPSQRQGLLERYGLLLKQLGGLYTTAPDIGSSTIDMDIIAKIASPYVFGCTDKSNPNIPAGSFAAMSVFSGIRTVCNYLYNTDAVRGKTVLVQGIGNVGRKLVEYLDQAGAIVICSDLDSKMMARLPKNIKARFIPANSVYHTECDIFSPCALGGILNSETIPQLACQAIVGAANNQLSEPDDAERLHKRGILYAPDYIVNVGEAMADLGMADEDWSSERAQKEVFDKVRNTLKQVLDTAKQKKISPETSASLLVEQRLKEEHEKISQRNR